MTRSYARTTSYGFFRMFRTAKNTTCNQVEHPVAAPESGMKHQLSLIDPHSFVEVLFRVMNEMGIRFSVSRAVRLALMAKNVL